MTMKNQNCEIWSGDTPTIRVDIISGTTNLETVQSIRYTIYRNFKPILVKDLDSGVEINPMQGLSLLVTLEPEDTENLGGQYYHEMEIVDEEGKVFTIMEGTVRIHRTALKSQNVN